MSSKDDVRPPTSTPREVISINTAFKDLEKAIEKTDPYGGATLPVTPASTPDSHSVRSIPGNGENMSDDSSTKRRKEALRSDSMQELWHRIEEKAARARLSSRETRAGCFSRLTFHWASSLLWVSSTLELVKHYRGSSDYLLHALQ